MLEHGDAAEAQALLAQLQRARALGYRAVHGCDLLEGIAPPSRRQPAAAAEAAFATAARHGDADIATRADFLLTSSRIDRGSLDAGSGDRAHERSSGRAGADTPGKPACCAGWPSCRR